MTVSCADIIIMAARDAVYLVINQTLASAPWIDILELKTPILPL
jgi:hypothetical protein